MIDIENADAERKTDSDKELADFIKETRQKSVLHDFLAIAAKSYIDGINTALRCQNAAQAVI